MYEYLFLELPHDRKQRTKVANENVDVVYQITAILNAYGKEGWEAVGFSESFTSTGSHFAPKFLLKRPIG